MKEQRDRLPKYQMQYMSARHVSKTCQTCVSMHFYTLHKYSPLNPIVLHDYGEKIIHIINNIKPNTTIRKA